MAQVIVVDANLLIYAYTKTSELHLPARRWIERAFSGPDPVRLPWSTLHAFLRITTQPALFAEPFTMERCLTLIEEWLGQPQVAILTPGERYWTIFRGLLRETQIRGNLVMDAHLAALTIENAATLYTTDKDFSRFDELRVVNPLTARR